MQAAEMADLAFRAVVGANKALTSQVPWIWIVEATYRDTNDETKRDIYVTEAPLDQRPEADELIPAGAELMRDVSFPASQFVDMASDTRDRYRPHYRAYLTFVVAKARGKKVDDMVRGVDYEPDAIDDQVQAWSRVLPKRRFA